MKIEDGPTTTSRRSQLTDSVLTADFWLDEMIFLPAEPAKDAGNEVPSRWVGDLGTSQNVSFTLGGVIQVIFSCRTVQTVLFVSLREEQRFISLLSS